MEERELKDLIRHHVRAAINESYGRQDMSQVPEELSNVIGKLKDYTEQLQGFQQEYPDFYGVMDGLMTKLGFEQKMASIPEDISVDNVFKGLPFEFRYVLSGIDVDGMSEEDYSDVESRLNKMYGYIEDTLDNSRFRYGDISVSGEDDGFLITYSFRPWS